MLSWLSTVKVVVINILRLWKKTSTSSIESSMCYTVSPVCHGCPIRIWNSLMLVVHAVVKRDSRVGRVSQCTGLAVTLHNIFI